LEDTNEWFERIENQEIVIEPYSEQEISFTAEFNSEVSNLYFEIEPKFHAYDKKFYSFDVYRNQMIGDINLDGWSDMFISNDFFEKDYLYINNKDGSFSESLEEYLNEISMGSMGADMADINNDGYPEIFVTEMLPNRHDRRVSKAVFDSWDKYQFSLNQGYFHQFNRNALQLNNQNNSFSEISRITGLDATDWSWGALIFDMDNDGNKDIFVANGIYKDLLDQDYVNFLANPSIISNMIRSEEEPVKKLIDMIPSEPLSNFAFKNFRESQDFINNVGKISEDEGHHPDIVFGWGYAKINITTHAIKGLSENDFILAAKIDKIANV